MNTEPAHILKPYIAYKHSGVECLGTQGSNEFYIFQTGLTGSTGFVSSLDPVHPVILSRLEEPQMNADERRLIKSAHRKGYEQRKAAQQSVHFCIEKYPRRRTRMTQIRRIFTDNLIRAHPCHPCNPCSIEYNSDRKISYQWHFSSIKEPEAAQ